MPGLPTGTVSLLFTDIEGSTRLLHELGDRYADALSEHRALLREVFAEEGGHEVDTQGDAFFVAFMSAAAAVRAAAKGQRRLAAHPWPGGHELRVRMGVHTGEPRRTDEGYVGVDLHRGARICSAGHGGQVLVSESTHQLLLGQDLGGLALRDLGLHRLKDLSEPQKLYQVVASGLLGGFPPLKTLENRPTNLPSQATPLLGRTEVLHEIEEFVRNGPSRVVTLTGPGGIGKTRLALHAGADLIDDFPGGVFVVTLAPISDPDLVVPTIAQTLGLREGAGRTIEQALHEFLVDRKVLLVLDNFEQVVGAAPEVAELVARAPSLSVLVSSRESLRVPGEQEVPVPPLPVPDRHGVATAGAETLSQYDAVTLFVERARAVRPTFQVTNENAPAVAEICVRLDGLPLALELAAARTKVLTPQAIMERLDHRLRLLTGGARGLPPRQQTLRGAIDWSFDLLPEAEQRLFARLAVFTGGWTLDAAYAICDPDVDLEVDVLDGLGSLVDKSLVRPSESVDGEPRFAMLETIREYAEDRLAEDPAEPRVRDAHADHYATLAWDAAPKLQRTEGRAWVRRLDEEQGNLRSALTWLSHRGHHQTALRLVRGAWRAWIKNGRLGEGISLMESVTAESPDVDSPDHAYTMVALGELYRTSGNFESARRVKEAALPVMRRIWPRMAATTLSDLGSIAEDQGRLDDALALHEEALAMQREAGDRGPIAHAMTGIARLNLRTGDLEASRSLYGEVLATGHATHDDEFVAEALLGLGWIERHEGHHEVARRRYEEALELCLEMNDQSYGIDALAGLGAVALDQGEAERAARLLGALDAVCTASGLVLYFPDEREAQLSELRTRLEPAALARAWAEGSGMTFEGAAALASERPEGDPPRT